MTKSFADKAAPVLDQAQYPKRWPEYIGQAKAKEEAMVAARSAKMRKAALEHTLVAHPIPGIGKTALAVLLAREMRSKVRAINGNMDKNTARMIFLGGMKDGDVLFVDEAHGMKGDWWLTYMQDFAIQGPLGLEQMPRVTIVAATTDPQLMAPALLDRFMLRPQLTEYSPPEAAKIVGVTSAKLFAEVGLPKVAGKDALALAVASRCNPRNIRRHLLTLRDLTITSTMPMRGTGYDIPGLLAYKGVDPDGLDNDHRTYLRVLAEEFQGAAGARPLADRLKLSQTLDQIEAPLMDLGLIAKTPRGRALTAKGINRYNEATTP